MIKFNNYYYKNQDLNKINQVKINLASSEKIQSWSRRDLITELIIPEGKKKIKYVFKHSVFSEVTNPNIIVKQGDLFFFDRNGLFCEKTFGPLNDFTCLCRDSKKSIQIFFKDCPKCGVTITSSKIRNYRLAYVPLSIPIFNTLFFSSTINFPKYFLSLKKNAFNNLIYFRLKKDEYLNYIKEVDIILSLNKILTKFSIKESKSVSLVLEKTKDKIKSEKELIELLSEFDENILIYYLQLNKKTKLPKTVNEKIFNFLDNFNISEEIKINQNLLVKTKPISIEYKFLSKKIRILENFYYTKSKLSWTMFLFLPVTPTNYRPYDTKNLDSPNTPQINSLYQNIIRINSRLNKLIETKIPKKELLLINEIRLLQEAIDFLLDQNKVNKKVLINDKPSKSLADIIKGKFGRFRKSILGKRINFSARSVIIVNPLLSLNQCAVPFKILQTLFSFKIDKIITKIKSTINLEKNINNKIYFIVLKKLIKNEVVMLNRAPTLHKLGVQAFNPIITQDNSIHLHPLVCSAYNADFDGDQMSVYTPLTKLSALELNWLMKSTKDLFLFGNSNLKMKPSQELILALYYLSLNNEIIKYFNFGNYFNNYNEFFNYFVRKKLNIHTPIWIKNRNYFSKNKKFNNFIRTTPGRSILNNIIKKKLCH